MSPKSIIRKRNRFLIVFNQQHSLIICSLTFLPRDNNYNGTKCRVYRTFHFCGRQRAEAPSHAIFTGLTLCSECTKAASETVVNFIHFVGYSVNLMSPDVISSSSRNPFQWVCFHVPFGNFLSWVTLTSVCPETRRGSVWLIGLPLWACGGKVVTYLRRPSLQPVHKHVLYTRGHPPACLHSVFLRPSFLSHYGKKVHRNVSCVEPEKSAGFLILS